MVAQEGPPLPVGGNVGGLLQHPADGLGRALAQRVEDAWHDREVEAHGALGRLLGAEVLHDVLGPLVGLGQRDGPGELPVEHLTDPGDDLVGAGQVLAVGALRLGQVGDGVEAEAVHPGARPEADDVVDGLNDRGVAVVEVGLVGEEAVPVELASLDVVGPVRLLGVHEDDAGVVVAGVVVGPHVEVPVGALGVRAGGLEPGVGVGGVVDDHVDDDADPALMGLVDQLAEVLHRSVARVDGRVVGDVVAAVTDGRGVEGRDPHAVHAQPRQVVQAGDEPAQVPDAVAVGVGEGAQQRLVEDGRAEPLGVRADTGAGLGGQDRYAGDLRCHRHRHGDPAAGGGERRHGSGAGSGHGGRYGDTPRHGLAEGAGRYCGRWLVAGGHRAGAHRVRAHSGSTEKTWATCPAKGSRRT